MIFCPPKTIGPPDGGLFFANFMEKGREKIIKTLEKQIVIG